MQLVSLSELSVLAVLIRLIFDCLGHICCKAKQIICGTYRVSSGMMLHVLCETGAKVAEVGSIGSKWGDTCLHQELPIIAAERVGSPHLFGEVGKPY